MKKNTKSLICSITFYSAADFVKVWKEVPEASHPLADIVCLGAFFKHRFCFLLSMYETLSFSPSLSFFHRCKLQVLKFTCWGQPLTSCEMLGSTPLLRGHPSDAPVFSNIECKVCSGIIWASSGIMLLVSLQMIFFWKIFRTIKLYNYVFSSIRTF